MAKEMILVESVEGLGVQGDVVRVSEGYARNFLLPRKLAAPVTEASRRVLEKKKEERREQELRGLDAAKELAKKIEELSCTINAKVGPEGKLFGSVGAVDIAAVLKEQGVNIDKHMIHLTEPFREVGVFKVALKLHPQIEATLKVWIVEE